MYTHDYAVIKYYKLNDFLGGTDLGGPTELRLRTLTKMQ